MHSWTGTRHEPAAITRIAESRKRLENGVKNAGFCIPHRTTWLMLNPFRKDSAGSGAQDAPRATVGDRLAQFERRQRQLWRMTYFLLGLLTIAYVMASWDTVRSFARRFDYLLAAGPGLILLVALFIVYVWKRNKEMAELRGLVRGIEQRHTSPPSDEQLDKLFSVIERSQQGYRDLIDSFDDILIAVTLDGEVRAANRSFSDLVGATFQDIIGHPLSEFVEDAGGDGATLIARAMPRFVEKRHWTGEAQIRLKKRHSVLYYECVIHAMLRNDEVHGMTILARDITASRRNEARFTELFETLQEGIYIVTPDGEILDANPALVRILGYESKSELMAQKVAGIVRARNHFASQGWRVHHLFEYGRGGSRPHGQRDPLSRRFDGHYRTTRN